MTKNNLRYRWLSVFVLTGLLATPTVLTAAGTDGVEARVWTGPGGKPLPFETDEQIKDFLLTANILEIENIPVGITDPRQVLLEKDGVRARACFRYVNLHRRKELLPTKGVRWDWRDSCLFEPAAYELGRLLGLHNIPPAVVRKIDGTEGTLQIWLEGALMEKDRAAGKPGADNPWRHAMQLQIMRVFDALVHNDDRNQQNYLYDSDWNLWMIDHTRCFPLVSDLPKPNRVRYCERSLWENLKSLDREVVEERLGDYLTSAEINSLFKRHKKLVKYIEKLIAQNGEGGVLFQLY